ncbi:hypothetical protein [Streptomyces sp. NPDC021622]|uniref:hypothetical protein n=1 Tax=Streptomyces sp. NPDC021622 TaxID=3155013 RepID=UPI0033E87E42
MKMQGTSDGKGTGRHGGKKEGTPKRPLQIWTIDLNKRLTWAARPRALAGNSQGEKRVAHNDHYANDRYAAPCEDRRLY